jgi:hypothetical protein
MEWRGGVPSSSALGGAYWVYIAPEGRARRRRWRRAVKPGSTDLVLDKWRVDELYDATVVRLAKLSAAFAAGFDKWIIDGLVNLVGTLAVLFGRIIKPIHTGAVQVYGAAMGLGALALVAWITMFPQASLATRAGDGGQTVIEVSGGPGYVYRWAVFDPHLAGGNRLADVCPSTAVVMALASAQPTRRGAAHGDGHVAALRGRRGDEPLRPRDPRADPHPAAGREHRGAVKRERT